MATNRQRKRHRLLALVAAAKLGELDLLGPGVRAEAAARCPVDEPLDAAHRAALGLLDRVAEAARIDEAEAAGEGGGDELRVRADHRVVGEGELAVGEALALCLFGHPVESCAALHEI